MVQIVNSDVSNLHSIAYIGHGFGSLLHIGVSIGVSVTGLIIYHMEQVEERNRWLIVKSKKIINIENLKWKTRKYRPPSIYESTHQNHAIFTYF